MKSPLVLAGDGVQRLQERHANAEQRGELADKERGLIPRSAGSPRGFDRTCPSTRLAQILDDQPALAEQVPGLARRVGGDRTGQIAAHLVRRLVSKDRHLLYSAVSAAAAAPTGSSNSGSSVTRSTSAIVVMPARIFSIPSSRSVRVP